MKYRSALLSHTRLILQLDNGLNITIIVINVHRPDHFRSLQISDTQIYFTDHMCGHQFDYLGRRGEFRVDLRKNFEVNRGLKKFGQQIPEKIGFFSNYLTIISKNFISSTDFCPNFHVSPAHQRK